MQNEKLNLESMPDKLTRMEMKKILGGAEPEENGNCSGTCRYLSDPNSTVFFTGECVVNTNPMQVGCACKRHDNFLQPGCN